MWGRGTKRKTLHSACTSGPYSLWHLFHLCPSLPPFPARLQLGLGFVHRRHLVRGPHLPGLTRCVQRPEPAQRLGACARLMTRVMAQVARVAPACHSKVSGLNTYIPKGPLDNEHQERQVLELDHAVRIPGLQKARGLKRDVLAIAIGAGNAVYGDFVLRAEVFTVSAVSHLSALSGGLSPWPGRASAATSSARLQP